jgi:hypothetical protein
MQKKTTYRLAIGLAVIPTLLTLWMNLAVGLIGEPENPANLLFIGVLVVAWAGAFIVRFNPARMTNVMYITAIAQAIVAVIAVFIGADEVAKWLWSLTFLNGVFIAFWLSSGRLFRKIA